MKTIDWAGIENDFCTSDMSVRELAKWYSVSEAAVRKRAKAGEWVRRETAPKAPVKKADISVTYSITQTPVTVETTSPEAIVGRGRNLVLRLLDELDTVTSRVGELEYMIDEATAEDEGDRRREAMMKAISLASRANTIKALATAAKTLAESGVGTPAGKKEAAAAAATTAGAGSGWGDDLLMPSARPN